MGHSKKMALLLKQGEGTRGYCKLCSFDKPEDQDQFDKRVLTYTPKTLNDWLATRGLKPVSRPTVYAHRKHVMSPEDRVISSVRARDIAHGKQPRLGSEDEFIDAIVQLGYENARANPGSVTIDQALKATSIKKQSKKSGEAHQFMINIFTGGAPEEAIEGEIIND